MPITPGNHLDILRNGEEIFPAMLDAIDRAQRSIDLLTYVYWDGEIGESGAFSSPVLATLAGRRQLVVQSRLELYGVDPEDGAVLWSQPVPNFRGMNILTPVVHGDTVFTSSYKRGSYLYRISATGAGFAVEEVWRHKSQVYMSSPIVVDGHAYLHLGSQRLTCLDLEAGEGQEPGELFGGMGDLDVVGEPA